MRNDLSTCTHQLTHYGATSGFARHIVHVVHSYKMSYEFLSGSTMCRSVCRTRHGYQTQCFGQNKTKFLLLRGGTTLKSIDLAWFPHFYFCTHSKIYFSSLSTHNKYKIVCGFLEIEWKKFFSSKYSCPKNFFWKFTVRQSKAQWGWNFVNYPLSYWFLLLIILWISFFVSISYQFAPVLISAINVVTDSNVEHDEFYCFTLRRNVIFITNHQSI